MADENIKKGAKYILYLGLIALAAGVLVFFIYDNLLDGHSKTARRWRDMDDMIGKGGILGIFFGGGLILTLVGYLGIRKEKTNPTK